MTNADIREFKGFIEEVLVKHYHMDEATAHKAVVSSYLSEALKKDPEYADHESVEEWAEIVYIEWIRNKKNDRRLI